MSDAPDPATLQPFVLVGGPGDGEITIVAPCKHGDFPDLVGKTGYYRLEDDTRLYKWHPTEETTDVRP